MFFKNFMILFYIRFFWFGLLLGCFKIFCNFICKLSYRNIFIVNIISFCFWSLFSIFFTYFCIKYNNYEFSIYGFLFMLAGIYFIKISVEFCFTKLLKLLYNKIDKFRMRKIHNGKLKSS